MPSRNVHIGKAGSFVRAIGELLSCHEPEKPIDPISTLAYYAAMHVFEACFAEGLGAAGPRHFTSHDDRVDAVLRGKHVFASKPARSFKTLYEFSRIARYAQETRTAPARAGSGRRRGPHLGQDRQTLDEVMRRLKRCVKKVREVLAVSEGELPALEWPMEARAGGEIRSP